MPSTGPSPHLSWAELACKDGTPYPAVWRDRAEELAAEFEAIRDLVGAPITILSAYRTADHNRKVGGASTSQHVEGRALDLKPPAGWTVAELVAICKARAAAPMSRLGAVGVYPTFVHIDIRPRLTARRLVCWSGRRAWAEAV